MESGLRVDTSAHVRAAPMRPASAAGADQPGSEATHGYSTPPRASTVATCSTPAKQLPLARLQLPSTTVQPALERPPGGMGMHMANPVLARPMQLPLEGCGSLQLALEGRGSLHDEATSSSIMASAMASATTLQGYAPSRMASEIAEYRAVPPAMMRQHLASTHMAELLESQRRPSAAQWRNVPQLQEQRWLCPSCHIVLDKTSEPACFRCGLTLCEVQGTSSSTFVAAVAAHASRLSYGRNLRVTQDRLAVTAERSAPALGTPGYDAWVSGQLAAFSTRPDDRRVEVKPTSDVCAFDAWLCMHSNGALRFYTREHVRAFMHIHAQEASVEAIVTDFVSDLGSSTLSHRSPKKIARPYLIDRKKMFTAWPPS